MIVVLAFSQGIPYKAVSGHVEPYTNLHVKIYLIWTIYRIVLNFSAMSTSFSDAIYI